MQNFLVSNHQVVCAYMVVCFVGYMQAHLNNEVWLQVLH